MAEAARQELTGAATVTVQSARFGTHTVPEECILTFTEGLVGIPQATRFWLAEPAGGPSPFRYLLSIDLPDLGFLVCDPCQLWPAYAAELPPAAEGAGDVQVLAIVTVREEPRTLTANLLAPLLVDCETRRGRQVVLDGARYSTRHPLTQPADPPAPR